MIFEQALKFLDLLKNYNAKMQGSANLANSKVYLANISLNNWKMHVKIKVVLKSLFIITEQIENNTTNSLYRAL